ncbi:MAG: DUF72 domain-containing protein [Candidatus Bathyarchaeia archaeon]
MIKVGCCGYPVSQKKYYETFSLVELNSTFYTYPSPITVSRWRKNAPKDFEFTVKAHQDISHKYRLKVDQAAEPFEKIKQICRVLEAKIIVIQTPASFIVDHLNEAKEFFKGINREDFTIVWETRGPSWESEDGFKRLRDVLSELAVTHVTDPLRLMPAYVSNVAYFRLHGLGERMYYYQYTNDELRALYEVVKGFEGSERSVYVLFNNLSMFEDARRFVSFIKEGCFPRLHESFGVNSIKSIISRVRYPATKNSLADKVGWRLIEFEDGRQIRLKELLASIPAKTYKSPENVLEEIKINNEFSI